jgi:hypothetical protein
MKHVMPHDLPPELARKVAIKAFESYQQRYAKYQPALTWLTEQRASVSMSAKGIVLSGTVELKAQTISFELEVPFMLRMFKGRALKVMARELEHWVAKARAGEL